MLLIASVVLWWLGFRLVAFGVFCLFIWGENAESRVVSAEAYKVEYKNFVESVWLPWVKEHKAELSTLDYVRYRFAFMYLSIDKMKRIIRDYEERTNIS